MELDIRNFGASVRRSTLDYFSNSSFAGPQGPLSFPLLLQMDCEYCVALELMAKVSHVRFSVGCCDREFLNLENFC